MRLMQRMEAVAARRHLSPRTLSVYQAWVRQFLRFHRDGSGNWRHPGELGGGDVGAFLTHLAQARRLSASSQNQAMNAILFVYRDVLGEELGPDHLGPIVAERAFRPRKVPTVLSADEVGRIIDAIDPARMSRLMVQLMYGTGMRAMECC